MTTNKYIKAVSYNIVYFLVSSLAYLVLTPIAIRVMGGEFYGLWMILFAVGQLSLIGTLGIETIVNKFAAEVKETYGADANLLSSAILVTLAMAFIVAAILFTFRGFLAQRIGPSPAHLTQFKNALAVYSLMIIPQFTIRVFHGFFLAQIMNRFVRLMDLLNSLLPLLGGVILSLVAQNLTLLALWNLFVSLIVLGVFLFRTYRLIGLRWLPTRVITRRLLGFSPFMFIESAAINLFQQFDRLLVALMLGPAASGIYSVATGVGLRMSIIAGSVTEVLLPYASRKHSLGEKHKLENIVLKVTRYISLMAALVGGLLIIWMKELLTVWISPQYAEANALFFCVIILAYSILSLSRPAHQTLVGLGKVRFTSLVYLGSAALMLVTLCLLSMTRGLLGAGYANLVMTLLLCMSLYLFKWFEDDQVWRYFATDLILGMLPLVVALILVGMRCALPLKWVFTIGLLGLVFFVLARDDELKARLKRLVTGSALAKSSERGSQVKDK
jgi:O-antigen/teichoic acid export membrane protein